MGNESLHELRILEQIEQNPDFTQADLASRLGVAVGTVNWYIKRLAAKGLLKVSQLQRRRLRYIVTPEGIAQRGRLAMQYLEISMALYRQTRRRATEVLVALRREGHSRVRLSGQSDLVDIVRLTCIEQGFEMVVDAAPDVPVLVAGGDGLVCIQAEIAVQQPGMERLQVS